MTTRKTTAQAKTVKDPATRSPGIGDDAVLAKTGMTWRQWAKALDGFRCQGMPHSKIAEIVKREFDLPDWWTQMVASGYERLRGLRVKGETPAGFQVGVSRTIEAPVARCYTAWTVAKTRRAWLGDAIFETRTSHVNKTLRYAWGKDLTPVEVYFSVKGPAKTQVVVQQGRLADATARTRCKAYWTKRLDALKALLESS